MDNESVRKLQAIFRVIFKLRDNADVTRLSRNGTVPWDSLTHATLVAAIESEFNIEIDAADALQLVSYQAACSLLEERGL